jgi:uncharacterized protein with von Willebrand factor type A (vWA) domain
MPNPPDELPFTFEVRGGLLENLLLFGRLCKLLGLEVTPNGMIEVAEALEHIQIGKKADFYFTLRALIVRRERDLALFDKAFSAFWRVPGEFRPVIQPPPPREWTNQRKMQFCLRWMPALTRTPPQRTTRG